MKKFILILSLMTYGWTADAKDKLYILNSASASGSFNAQMIAYAEDLKQYYDVEYVQGKGCNKASATIKKIVENKQQVFYIWNGLRTADYLNGKNDLCGKIPNKQNFVNSVLKYGMFFTIKDGINKKDIFKSGLKVGYNSNTNRRYLEALAKLHGVEWQLVQYENSNGVRLGVLNKEVDWGMINSASSFWSKADKLKALYTLNSRGENGIDPLTSVTKFSGADNGVADLFLIEGGDNKKLRSIVNKILSNPKSKISIWYDTAKGYTQTIDLDVNSAIAVSKKEINHWVKINKLK